MNLPRGRPLAVASLFVVAALTRVATIGDPALLMDEQFYLLVADRMWHGALPYVDIWDRKPIGLFLIYAALRPLSPQGIVAYQLGALTAAFATACLIAAIARRMATLVASVLAGVVYLCYLPVMGGGGGQAAVFYNLPVTAAAYLLMPRPAMPRAGAARPNVAMLLFGLAIQIKYTAAAQGIALGLWLLGREARAGGPAPRLLAKAVGWVSLALAPTAAALAYYWWRGALPQFVDANFFSIFRVGGDDAASWLAVRMTAFRLAPLALVAGISWASRAMRAAPAAMRVFLAVWTGGTVIEFLLVGHHYYNYALPMLAPLAIGCAPLFRNGRTAAAATGLFAAGAIAVTGFPWGERRASHIVLLRAMADATRPYAGRGCLYLNDAPTILYLQTGMCAPTPYVFPEHLNNAAEADAIGADRAMSQLLAARPAVVFEADRGPEQRRNARTAAMLDRALAADYRLTAVLTDVEPGRHQRVYVRRDLVAR